MTEWHKSLSDDEVLDHLRSAFDEQVPVSMVDMIMAGYDITNIDANIAELVEDVSIDELATVRSASTDSRFLTFTDGDLSFELEIGPTAPEVVGHVEPPRAGSVHLEQADHSERLDLDAGGNFEFGLSSTRPFRLRFQPPTGRATVTDWILP